MKRRTGVVVNWFGDQHRDFGFIRPDGGPMEPQAPQLFCHLSDCAAGVNGLAENMRVSYIEAMGQRGPKAVDCRPIEAPVKEMDVADRTSKLSR
jgi:cold shock CspA family protein